MSYKKSFSLFELILVVFISSIVLIYTFIFTKDLYFVNEDIKEISILKIDLNSSKVFLNKHKENLQNKLKFKENTLYYKNSILLKDVNKFSITSKETYYKIDIEVKNLIKQTWKIKK